MKYINMDFLTWKEKQKWLTAQLKIAELETIIRFRELEKHIEEGININTYLLLENELKEYKNSKIEISIIGEIEEKRRSEKAKQKEQNINCVFEFPVWVCKLFKDTGLCKSFNETKRLIKQKGLYLNKKVIENIDQVITEKDAVDGLILLQRGKKQFYKISVK